LIYYTLKTTQIGNSFTRDSFSPPSFSLPVLRKLELSPKSFLLIHKAGKHTIASMAKANNKTKKKHLFFYKTNIYKLANY